MLKSRIIGVVIVKSGLVVQSIGFSRYLPVGKPEIAVEYLDRWGIDEIVLLDIDATAQGRSPDFSMVQRCSAACQVPLAVGGGITKVDQIVQLVRCGADKVVLNSSVLNIPGLVTAGGERIGQQGIVVSIDACSVGAEHKAYRHDNRSIINMNAEQLAVHAEELGAGEIFINSVDNDGAKQGYDTELISRVAAVVNVPVIACGGAGHPQHMLPALKAGASAVAAGNFFHYTEHSVIVCKEYLKKAEADIRCETYARYQGIDWDKDGRAACLPEQVLEEGRFEYVLEEKI